MLDKSRLEYSFCTISQEYRDKSSYKYFIEELPLFSQRTIVVIHELDIYGVLKDPISKEKVSSTIDKVDVIYEW